MKDEFLEKIKNTGYHLAQKIYSISSYTADITELISRHGWKMLNYINSNNKEKFIEYIYRLYWGYGLQHSREVFEILQTDSQTKFKKYALAFLNGFISEPQKES